MKTLLLAFLISTPAFAGGGSSVGVGNPAAKFCLELGGKLERTQSKEGEDANCAIEEWKLWTAMDKQNLVRPIHRPGGIPNMPNPASVNCNDIGGELRIEEGQGGQYGICVVEQWKLYGVFHK